MQRMWIDLVGLANLRDLGGLPTTDGGKIVPGRLLRSDNLQTLTPADIDQLLGLGLTDVVDLRSDYERQLEGPGATAQDRRTPARVLAVPRVARRGRRGETRRTPRGAA